MVATFDQLVSCADTQTLRSRLAALCAPFGTLRHLDVLASVQSGRRQAMCFLRMSSDAEDSRLSEAFGIGRFGGDLVAVIELGDSLSTTRPPAFAP